MKKIVTAVILLISCFMCTCLCSCQEKSVAEKRATEEIEQQLDASSSRDIFVTKNGEIAVITANHGGTIRYVLFGQQSAQMDTYILAKHVKQIIKARDDEEYLKFLKLYVSQ